MSQLRYDGTVPSNALLSDSVTDFGTSALNFPDHIATVCCLSIFGRKKLKTFKTIFFLKLLREKIWLCWTFCLDIYLSMVFGFRCRIKFLDSKKNDLYFWRNKILYVVFKGTGTRDLIWLEVVSLERSWWVP